MSNRRKVVILLSVIVVLTVLAGMVSRRVLERPAAANDGVVFTSAYTLSNTISHPLVVIADTVDLSGDSHITDNAALVGRTHITLSGQIDGDLSAMGDQVLLDKSGRVAGDASLMGNQVVLDGQVDGDLTVISDTLTINPGAQVNGDITACVTHLSDERSGAEPIGQCSQAESSKYTALQSLRDGTISLDAFNGLSSGGFSSKGLLASLAVSLFFTGLAALAVTAFPRSFSYLTEALQTRPRRMAGMGCLTWLLAVGGGAILVVVLAKIPVLGLLLLPVGFVLGILLLGMVITGWIALALVIGSWLVNRLSSRRVPALVAVVLGSIVLFLLWHILALLPFGSAISFLLMVVLGSIGLGAAFTTRLGTRPLRRSYFVQG